MIESSKEKKAHLTAGTFAPESPKFATMLPGALLVLPAAFYLPGVAPREYLDQQPVDLKVNKLTSTKTQLPYEFYSLPFCQPALVKDTAENLGEVMRGDKIVNSDYDIKMNTEESCKVLCKKNYEPNQLAAFSAKVDDDYRVNWIVDNLPAATRVVEPGGDSGPTKIISIYERGFPLGFKGSADIPLSKHGTNYLYNHHRLVLKYHTEPASFEGARIVGFEVEPFSVKHILDDSGRLTTCSTEHPVTHSLSPQPLALTKGSEEQVIFTYDVRWEYSEVKWASRWDIYLYATDEQIHWFSIVNSLMIVFFLTGMLAMIIVRTLHRDLRRYNEVDMDDIGEETGWKLVHGDVFRPPSRPALLSVYIGTGIQLLGMTVVTMAFAVAGFLSPSNRGALGTALILVFMLMGLLAGYTSSRLYKALSGYDWRLTTLKTALMFPGIVFGVFFILNLFIWGEKSSGAVPFTTMLAIICMWFGISVPLVYIGAFVGYRSAKIEMPTKTNMIPRAIPEQEWYTGPLFSILIGGILPFGAVFIELFFILSSIWLHQYYYVFGSLLIVFLILVVTCAEISIVMCYFHLCAEDYSWWWRSFLTSGSSGIYLFIYSLIYMSTKMVMTRSISILMYIGYMLIASYTFTVLTGTVGFCATFYFVRCIYGAVKVE